MIDISPELVTIVMLGGLLIIVHLGYPLGVVLGGIAMIVGFLVMGDIVFHMFRIRILAFISNYILLAVPLFIFMGIMVQKSGAAERLYAGLYLWSGGLRGGLAVGSIAMGTILAACVGVIAASVTMIGLIAIPSMLKRGYNKELITGSVCAGGTLGILIPPSIMLIVYGPMAMISVGRLFAAALIPGLILSGLYIAYITIRCFFDRDLAPSIPAEERRVSLWKKLYILLTSMVPPAFLILAVLGSIFFGIAAPTEAAGVGALAAMILAASYRRLNWQVIQETALQTMKVTCTVFLIGVGAFMFTGVFLHLGGGEVVSNAILAAPGGRWGIFFTIMFIVFVLGKFIDWIGIVFIIVPLITPIGADLGFDPLWFAMMVIVNLQMSFLTPPFAYAIFYTQTTIQPGMGIEIGHIMRGVIPFVILIMVALGLLIAFPELILWLPGIIL